MNTLSYGFKKPSTGDKGSLFFPALEDNIQQLNDHNHDGTNSASIPGTSISSQSQTILAASWVLVGDGVYRQLVTCPSPITVEQASLAFQIASGVDANKYFYPSITKVTSNTFYVYINDNSVDVKVIYR